MSLQHQGPEAGPRPPSSADAEDLPSIMALAMQASQAKGMPLWYHLLPTAPAPTSLGMGVIRCLVHEGI